MPEAIRISTSFAIPISRSTVICQQIYVYCFLECVIEKALQMVHQFQRNFIVHVKAHEGLQLIHNEIVAYQLIEPLKS